MGKGASSQVALRLTLPFRCRGRDGTIRVAVRPNLDPLATGHDQVAANFDEHAFRGFPVTTAEVDHPGEGPSGWFAWIQWIKHVRSGEVVSCELDSPPWLNGPYYVIGYRPTFADAPCNPDHLDLDWIATTYLTVTERSPGGADATETLIPLAGFTWGYRRGRPDDPTQLLPPAVSGPADWAELAPLMADESSLRPASVQAGADH